MFMTQTKTPNLSQFGAFVVYLVPVYNFISWRLFFAPPISTSSCQKCVSWRQRLDDGDRVFHAFRCRAQGLVCGHAFSRFPLLEQQWPDLVGPFQLLILIRLIVYP